jgi:Sugar-specific transcriptional regulator TrmB.
MSTEYRRGANSIDEGPTATAAFEVLGDESARQVFSALDRPRSAKEVAAESDVPLSTVYRALDRLTDAALADRTIVIRDDGNRVFRFVRSADTLRVDASGEELSVTPASNGPTPSASD